MSAIDEKPDAEGGPQALQVPPQVLYGISMFQMEKGEPVMHVHSGDGNNTLSVADLWRLAKTICLNLELKMQRESVKQALAELRDANPKSSIIVPR